VDPEVFVHAGKPLAVGEFYDVEITGADDYDLYGTTGHE
jgi:ribosomal protein S12 methylthiotransferase